MEKLVELRRKLGVLTDELNTDAIIADAKAYEAKEAEIVELEERIKRAEGAAKRGEGLLRRVGGDGGSPETLDTSAPVPKFNLKMLDAVSTPFARRGWSDDTLLSQIRKVAGFAPNKDAHFETFGEQLIAIKNYYVNGRDVGAMDKRLVRAPTGAGEIDAPSGGFLVQTDFSTAVFMRAYELGELLNRVQKYSISTNANSIKIPAVDETSRATGSRYGGVQSYWLGEGNPIPASRPKFRLIELDLKKLASLMYVTDELLADQSILNSIATKAFSEEITFMTEDAIWEGDGAGKPQGILNSNATIAVPKINGQATATVVYENIVAMWARMWPRSRQNAVWFINQDVEAQLYTMTQAIGTAGVPVYLPANGISGSPYGTLFGRPVVPIEYGSALGTQGDIALLDLSQYILADKGGVNTATSMHVAFVTDEMAFRITYRVDGEAMWNAPLTPFKGSLSKSPFVTLATR